MTELSTNGYLISRPLFDCEDEDREIEKKTRHQYYCIGNKVDNWLNKFIQTVF